MENAAKRLDRIRGMFVPVPTPFDGDGEVDECLYDLMCREYVNRGANALFLLGSVGQGPAMRMNQRKRAVEIAVEAVGTRVPVVPNVGTVDPYSARDLGCHARDHGVAAIALVGPYYYSDRSTDELILHYKMIDEAVGMPIFLYDNPAYQGYSATPAVMAQMRSVIPHIFGVKIAKGGIRDILRYQAALGREFKIFAPLQNLFPGMLIGQSGTVSPPLLMAVEVGVAFVSAIDRGDTAEALRIHCAMLRFSQALGQFSRWGRSVQLEGLRHAGFAVKQYPRWPSVAMPADEVKALHACIDEVQSVLK